MYILAAGVSSILGGWLALVLRLERGRIEAMSALSAGFLLGAALLTLIPAAIASSPSGPLFVGGGYSLMLLLSWWFGHQCHGDSGPSAPTATAATAGLLFHALMDGAALGISAQGDLPGGRWILLSLLFHKLSEGFSLALVVRATTHSQAMVTLAVGGLGAATMLGALVPQLWFSASNTASSAMIGLAAGSILYVAASDLLPGLVRRSPRAIPLIVLGVAIGLILNQSGHHH